MSVKESYSYEKKIDHINAAFGFVPDPGEYYENKVSATSGDNALPGRTT